MTLPSRILMLAVVSLLAIGPTYAQSQGSDISGSTSDMSGALTQSDAVFLQTDEVRIRMSDVASSITQALRSGTLGSSLVGQGQNMTVPPAMTDLLMASSRKDAKTVTQPFVDVLTANGLPQSEATALAKAATGLLDGGTISPQQFLEAVTAFNATINVAPASFLAQPPHELVVVRAVLMALLEGAV